MTWLVWRQHRIEILALLVGAGLIATALAVGADLAVRTRAELGIDSCQPLATTNMNCVALQVEAAERLQAFRWILPVLFVLPALVGAFVGGPLFAREFERGTHRLAWTQGITRLRWSAAKLGVMLLVAMVAAILVGQVGRADQISRGADAFTYFSTEGPAVVSHTIFAVAVAAFVGTLSRRILGGMLGGLLVFGAVLVGVMFFVRPFYEPPVASVHRSMEDAMRFQVPDGAGFIGTDYVDAEGNVLPDARLVDTGSPGFFHRDRIQLLAENGIYQRVRYQPADRYWRFQWTEALLFLTLSAAVSAGTLLLIKRRDA